jgi:hypothetical protein
MTGVWYFVTATWDGTNRRIYLNANNVVSDTPTGHAVTTTSNLNIGGNSLTGYLNGSVYGARIYPRALTQTEITQLYNYVQ